MAKAIGIVLVVPALMLARFLPPSKWNALACVVLVPVGVYLSMATDAYVRAGLLTPEATGGMNLAGHVAGFLDGELSDAPGFVGGLREAIRPILAKRPPDLATIRSRQDLDAYVDYTAREHDTILGLTLVPAAASMLAPLGTDEYKKLDGMLMRVGFASIMANPSAYIKHVAAHYYGLWRDLGRYFPTDLPSASVFIRQKAGEVDPYWSPEISDKYFHSLLPPMPSPFAAEAASSQQQEVALAFRRFLGFPIFANEMVTVAIGTTALFLPILWLFPGGLAHSYRSEIMLALVLDAYALGHALFQVSLVHYAALMMPTVMLFAFCFGVTSFRLARRAFFERSLNASGFARDRRRRAGRAQEHPASTS
jgi:hypothetical protein